MRRFFARFARHQATPAEALYASVVAASRQKALYDTYGVPDTLEGRFEMLAMHLFACVHSLTLGHQKDPELARDVAEVFVQEMDTTLREMGISDKRVPRRMKALFSAYGGRLGAYGASLTGEGEPLEEVLGRNIYDEGADPDLPVRLAAYLRFVLAELQEAPVAAFREGRPPFPPAHDLPAAAPPPSPAASEIAR
ncbi:ubiquinol-cytochrome C chaperone family protein [Afifella pfennigii]|uniref:ubiquinol-cytochrome C chaperone family protein n=1 Tax=Afifella pfennigii TaxID=209897 RepID=UPI000690AF57|nr:ubiquinol-cytochrome C chaperone family protein [Afifella pfennigii]